MAKFKKGEVVMLQSGGPSMTIISVFIKGGTGMDAFVYEALTRKFGDSECFYVCNWFVGTDLKEGTFTEEALKEYKDE